MKSNAMPVNEATVPVLSVSNLTVSFPQSGGWTEVLSDVNLRVDRNEIVCLVGESGSGKSVAAMTAVGLTRYAGARIDEGSIRFDGEELVHASNKRLNRLRGKQTGFIFQEPMTSLNPAFTVGNQLCEVLRLHLGMTRQAANKRAAELLEMVELPDPEQRLADYPHQLSGGMRQRVMIAMAIAARPKLLIADEPTTALDLTVQANILELLQRLRSELQMAILLITHDFGVVAEIADRVTVMYAGQVVENAPASILFETPKHPYTSALLGSLPQMCEPGERFGSIIGTVPSPDQMPPGCRFHPRCAHVVAGTCTQLPIAMTDNGASQVRCIRANELQLEGT
jgi:oligopeptide/dipeptide ABC transporter ATP-binding protein